MVHVSGDDKVILSVQKREQLPIHILWRIDIAVIVDMPRPPCPARFLIGKRIEAAGVDILNAKPCGKVTEVPVKAFPGIGQSSRSGQSGAGANHNSICALDFLLQPFNLFRPASCTGRNA